MVVRQQHNPDDNSWSVLIDGVEIISHESYTIASRIADGLDHPNREIGTEIGEVCHNLRSAYRRNGGRIIR